MPEVVLTIPSPGAETVPPILDSGARCKLGEPMSWTKSTLPSDSTIMIGLLPPVQCSEAQANSAVVEGQIVSKLDVGAVFVFAEAVELGAKHHAWLSFPDDWTMSTFCVAACCSTANAA